MTLENNHHLHQNNYRVEVLDAGIPEAPRDLLSRDNSSNRMSITHGFANSDDIRNDILSINLESPHVAAHTTKANLNLVGYTDTTSSTHVSVEK